MARNRRNSESMKFAIGRRCFLLLAGVLCVGFSLIKIVVGSEYVSKCPSREMIPVYIIVSGCLPVLLGALRQPYDSGHEMEKDKWSMKLVLIIAVIGVMVNLAWLVAGTYLVVSIWSGNICSTPPLIIHETISIPETVTKSNRNGTFQSELKQKNDQINSLNEHRDNKNGNKIFLNLNQTENIINIDNTVVNDTVPPKHSSQKFQTTLGINETMTEPTKNPKMHQPRNNMLGETANDTKNSNIVNGIDVELRSSEKFVPDGVIPEDIVSSSKTGRRDNRNGNNFIKISLQTRPSVKENADISKTNSQDKPCITCDMHILRFSLAVIIIDWLFVTMGIVYFCNFVCRRFSSIKSEILLINT